MRGLLLIKHSHQGDKYPLQSLLDFTAGMASYCVFSCIDLVKGYHQVPMSEGDIAKMTIIT